MIDGTGSGTHARVISGSKLSILPVFSVVISSRAPSDVDCFAVNLKLPLYLFNLILPESRRLNQPAMITFTFK